MGKKYKTRLVEKDYDQDHGIDYLETFATVEKMNIFKIIIAFMTQKGSDLYQNDVKMPFSMETWMKFFLEFWSLDFDQV